MGIRKILERFGIVVGKILPYRYQRFVPKQFRKYIPGHRWQDYSKQLILLGAVLIILGTVILSVFETSLYIYSVKKLQFDQAQRHAQIARPIVQFLSVVSFTKIPDIEAWKYTLLLADDLSFIQSISNTVTASIAQPGTDASLQNIPDQIGSIIVKLEKIQKALDGSLVAKHFISPVQRARIAQTQQLLTQLAPVFKYVFSGKQTWVVVFQNSDELRATGGFAGSYALVTIQDGQIAEIVIEDIYDADGQFAGYLAAPAGIREYTSSSRGLRLPDANWFPHFPQSAQTMLQFFAFGNKKEIKGIITVNLSVAEKLLQITGPLTIPDYATTVSAENLHYVLREERGEFFPGSIQKKHILSQVMTVLRQRLLELPPEEQLHIFKQLGDDLYRKEIQVYAINPDLQSLLSTYGITGEVGMNTFQRQQLQSTCAACQEKYDILFLVESNVGINKANRYIARSVQITERDTKIHLAIELHNTAQKSTATLLSPVVGSSGSPLRQIAANGYANYQRLLISPHYKLVSVTANSQPITTIDTETLEYEGNTVTQYGFLTIVLPEETQVVELVLQPEPGTSFSDQPLLIQKQSGIAPVPYSIQLPSYQTSFILEQDRLITWQQ